MSQADTMKPKQRKSLLRRVYNTVQKGSRNRFLFLLFLVSIGGLVDLLSIGTTAEMMGLVATRGESIVPGPLSYTLKALEIDDTASKLRFGLIYTIIILGLAHAYKISRTYFGAEFSWRQSHELSTKLFRNCLGHPYSWFVQRNSGEIHRLLGSGGVMQKLVLGVLAAAAQISTALVLSIALIVTEPRVAFCALVVISGAYGLVRVFTRKTLGERGSKAHRSERLKRIAAQEAITNIRFVKTTGRESFFADRYSKHAGETAQGMVFHGIYVDTVRAFLEWVTFASILALSVYLVSSSEAIGDLLPKLTLYTMAGYRIIPAIQELFKLSSVLSFDADYLNEAEQLLAAEPTVVRNEQEIDLNSGEESLLALDKVSLHYEEAAKPSLNAVSIEIGKGSWVGVVGTTGAGKTSLLDLISGLIEPTGGAIYIAGQMLDAKVIKDWQSRIAVVPQEVILLDDTLMHNVAFGLDKAEIDIELVKKVCNMSGLETFVAGLPKGLDTRLGERGTRLSGGERQRVGLARALYRKPSLLLLDEATSALDQATERRIIDTLQDVTAECTMITVAHRLSSVRPCDRIIVLEHGQVVGSGTYEELFEANEAFKKLALVATG